MTPAVQDMPVLVAEDQAPNRALLERILRSGGHTRVSFATDGQEAVDRFAEEQPDLLLLDLNMPRLNGFDVLERLGAVTDAVPVVVLTADANQEARLQALRLGARDFVTKPFDRLEVLLRVRNHLQTRGLTRRLADDMHEARHEVLERLAAAAEFRDDDTGDHTRRVGRTARLLAEEVGLDRESAIVLGRAAALHDVGKIGVPDAVLLKPGRLDAAEYAAIQEHCLIGARILSGSPSPVLRAAEEVALTHHERWDGRGYPHRLGGEDIPLPGRITAVADVFDALAHSRAYKPAWPLQAAVDEILRQAGRQFDPDVAAAFAGLDHGELLAPAPRPNA
jgi:putative two-component system response regulator